MLINTIMLQTLSVIALEAAYVFEQPLRTLARMTGINANDLCYAFKETLALFAYLASFMIPAFIFMFLSRKEGYEPMRLGVRMTPDAPLLIIGAIGIVLTSAYLNSIMVSFIDFNAVFESEPLDTPVKVMVSFIAIAVVPAVCEEFLFRGCVLSNLLPYGKTTALIGSALLFALMHGNFAQLFYTFVAGLVLGAVYIETGSIWTSTFIHLFNNFYSLIQQVVYERGGESEEINIILFLLDVMIPIAGLAIAAWLICKKAKSGKHEAAAIPTKKIRLDSKSLLRGFFNPVMIVYIAISLGLALLIVMTAITLGSA